MGSMSTFDQSPHPQDSTGRATGHRDDQPTGAPAGTVWVVDGDEPGTEPVEAATAEAALLAAADRFADRYDRAQYDADGGGFAPEILALVSAH